MRILFVNNYCEEVGGKEKYLNALRRNLRESGHVVATMHSVPTLSPSIESDEIRFCIPGIDRYRDTAATLTRLRECTTLFKPDVVHMHHDAGNLIAVRWLARHFPTLRTVHDVELLCPVRYYVRNDTQTACGEACGRICFTATCLQLTNPRSWYRLLHTKTAQRIYSRLTRVDSQSQYLLANLSKAAKPKRGGKVLPIFRDDRERDKEVVPIPDRARAFAYVGRLNPWKGPQFAIEAMKYLPADCHLYIVGSGAMDHELRNLVQTQGLASRVTFSGHLEGRELWSYYQRSLALIVPSIIPENCPLVILEAMMASRPVIASHIGGIPELIRDGVNGYLVRPNDAFELSDAMERVLANVPAAQEMGKKGREFVSQEKFDRQWHLETLIHEYKSVIQHVI